VSGGGGVPGKALADRMLRCVCVLMCWCVGELVCVCLYVSVCAWYDSKNIWVSMIWVMTHMITRRILCSPWYSWYVIDDEDLSGDMTRAVSFVGLFCKRDLSFDRCEMIFVIPYWWYVIGSTHMNETCMLLEAHTWMRHVCDWNHTHEWDIYFIGIIKL